MFNIIKTRSFFRYVQYELFYEYRIDFCEDKVNKYNKIDANFSIRIRAFFK